MFKNIISLTLPCNTLTNDYKEDYVDYVLEVWLRVDLKLVLYYTDMDEIHCIIFKGHGNRENCQVKLLFENSFNPSQKFLTCPRMLNNEWLFMEFNMCLF